MRTEVHPMAVPRLVVGVHHRCSAAEPTVCVDDVPVEIARWDEADAPRAFRLYKKQYRIADGAAYVEYAAGGFAAGWGRAWAAILRDLPNQIWGNGIGTDDSVESIHGWAAGAGHLVGASRRRGIGAFDQHRFREVHDDGRARQAAAARAIAGRMILVGDALLLRCETPRYEFPEWSQESVGRARCPMPRWRGPLEGEPFGPDDFRLDRPEEIRAYAALSTEAGSPARASLDGIEILDPGALAGLYDAMPCGDDLGVMAAGHGAIGAMRDVLGHLPEREIARFLEMRALIRSGDGPGALAWLDGLAGTRAAAEAAGWRLDDFGRRRMARHFERAALRLDGIERPRLDMAALGADRSLLRP